MRQAGGSVPDGPAEAARPPLWRRLAILDWIAIILFVLGWTAVATGLLPAHDARATVTRILPLLVFLGSVVVLARLDSEAQLFDVLAPPHPFHVKRMEESAVVEQEGLLALLAQGAPLANDAEAA